MYNSGTDNDVRDGNFLRQACCRKQPRNRIYSLRSDVAYINAASIINTRKAKKQN